MPVRADIDGGVAVVTLDRPPGNALDLEFLQSFAEACDVVAAASGVRAILLRAEGKHFCVGGDLAAFHAADDLSKFILAATDALHRGVLALRSSGVPIVVAVRGNAAGAGMSLAAVGDLLVAGRSTKFVLAYAAIGLSPDGGSSWTLGRILGARRLTELYLTNRPLGAEEAHQLGLVTHLVDDEAVEEQARALVDTLAAGPTAAFVAGKRVIAAAEDNGLSDQLELEGQVMSGLGATVDANEGIAAFLEKRAVRFSGS